MATHPLNTEHRQAHSNIEIGARAAVAVAAHLEVRAILRQASVLTDRGLADVLIGSYARQTGIWPGKDVDVFGKLTGDTIDTITPGVAYNLFHKVLHAAFGTRVVPQDRSIKIEYRPDRAPAGEFITKAAQLMSFDRAAVPSGGFEFSVDVVPAVRFGKRWGIPNRNPDTWTREAAAERWLCTDPERLTQLTTELNQQLLIGGQGAYVPTVKSVRQIRRAHLGAAKPGGFFFELIVHEGFTFGQIKGDSWADLTASALRYIADRLTTVTATPLKDPALGTPYSPTPDPAALSRAAAVFADLANRAESTLTADGCPAAATWRFIFGDNSKVDGPVFPLPPGCRGDGTIIPVFNTSPRDTLRGTNDARGFGCD